METINGQKEFDCLEMKRKIQAKFYAEIINMTAEERILYFRIPPEQDPFRRNNKKKRDIEITQPVSFLYGILVNRQGVIVDHGSHVRATNKLREKIDLLLKQDKLIKL